VGVEWSECVCGGGRECVYECVSVGVCGSGLLFFSQDYFLS
jgi:hypothetical protein